MAIQTGGFSVDVMPRYSPVDPSMVSIDPNRVVNGVLSSFQVADAKKRIKAFQDLQDELTATREGRIQALNSANDTTVATNAANRVNIVPRASLEGATIAADTGLVPILAKTKGLQAEAQGAEAEQAIATAPLKKTTALVQAQGEANRANDNELLKSSQLAAQNLAANFALEVDPIQHQIIRNKLEDELVSAKSDKDRKDALEQANIDYLKAHAKYMLGLGRQGAAKVNDPAKEAEYFTNQINRFNNLQVGPQKTDTLAAYEANTYDENGKLKTDNPILSKIPGVTPVPKQTNAVAESYRKQRDMLQKALDKTLGELARGKVNPTTPVPSTIPKAHIDALIANPGKAADFDELYGEGQAEAILNQAKP